MIRHRQKLPLEASAGGLSLTSRTRMKSVRSSGQAWRGYDCAQVSFEEAIASLFIMLYRSIASYALWHKFYASRVLSQTLTY